MRQSVGDERRVDRSARREGRIVVVTNGNFFSRVILGPFSKSRVTTSPASSSLPESRPEKTRRQSLSKILATGGLRHFSFKASTYLVFALSSQVLRKRTFFVHQLAKRLSLDICFTRDVNEPWVRDQVASWRPEILVSVSCPQRIDTHLLASPTKAAVNIHSSLLPRYAGIEPYIWVLAKGERKTGTTVHVMREAFDTGDILAQRELSIRPGESVFSLFYRLAILGGETLKQAIDAISTDLAKPIQQHESGRTYFSWPSVDTIRAMYANGHRFVRPSDFRRALSETH